MRRVICLIVQVALLAIISPTAMVPLVAQRRHPEPRGRTAPHPPVRAGAVVFVGGYFYDPFFGPYPWWARPMYPHPYYPVFEMRSIVRINATPKDAAVYADGFYAGTVHDFNDFFQGLPLSPGGHEIVLYLDGYRTIHRRIYLSAGTSLKLQETMERLSVGEASEPPTVAPPIPPPPDGSFIRPRSLPPMPPPPPRGTAANIAFGTFSLRVQPSDAEVRVDGERWITSDGGSFVLQLSAGRHRLDVTRPGYRPYSGDVVVNAERTTLLNVGLIAG